MHIEAVVKLAQRAEIDYQFLLSLLQGYAHPRDKITRWIKSGDLIRVKKGLYVFGKRVAESPYSVELLANLIYGPSAISLSYALSYYGLIPERVTTITSITNKRNKKFSTPVGEFTYTYLNNKKYAIGIALSEQSRKNHFFIATPEKALCDFIYLSDQTINLMTMCDVEQYLFHDLRIDESILQSLKIDELFSIGSVYHDARLQRVVDFIRKWKRS